MFHRCIAALFLLLLTTQPASALVLRDPALTAKELRAVDHRSFDCWVVRPIGVPFHGVIWAVVRAEPRF